MKTVMQYNPYPSAYSDIVAEATPQDADFLIKEQLYEQYRSLKKRGYKGTFEEYLSYRDYS